MPQESIRIDSELVKMLREFNAKTGVPISKVVEEAVEVWLICSAPVRLEAFGAEPLIRHAELEAAHIKKHRIRGPELVAEAAEEKRSRQGQARVIKEVRKLHANDRQEERAAQPGQFQTRVPK
jgi:hypothetical protein